jgi:hypothetical protein
MVSMRAASAAHWSLVMSGSSGTSWYATPAIAISHISLPKNSTTRTLDVELITIAGEEL